MLARHSVFFKGAIATRSDKYHVGLSKSHAPYVVRLVVMRVSVPYVRQCCANLDVLTPRLRDGTYTRLRVWPVSGNIWVGRENLERPISFFIQ